MGITVAKTVGLILFAIFANRFYTLLGLRHDVATLRDKHFTGFECNNILIETGAEDISTTSGGLAFITTGMYYPPFSQG